MSPRFSIYVWHGLVAQRVTLDEVHAEIERDHRARQRACGFPIERSVAHLSPDEEIPFSGGYHIVDHHEDP